MDWPRASGLPGLLELLALAKLRAQFFQDRRGPRDFSAADFQPLKLGQQVAARRRRQPLQVFLNLVGPHHGKQFPQFKWRSAIARRAGTHRRPLVEMEPRKAVLRKLQIKSSTREMTGVRA